MLVLISSCQIPGRGNNAKQPLNAPTTIPEAEGPAATTPIDLTDAFLTAADLPASAAFQITPIASGQGPGVKLCLVNDVDTLVPPVAHGDQGYLTGDRRLFIAQQVRQYPTVAEARTALSTMEERVSCGYGTAALGENNEVTLSFEKFTAPKGMGTDAYLYIASGTNSQGGAARMSVVAFRHGRLVTQLTYVADTTREAVDFDYAPINEAASNHIAELAKSL